MKNLLIVFFATLILSCNHENGKSENQQISIDSLASEDKVYWATDGNLNSDTVLLICSGGPKWYLDIEEKGKTNYRYIPRYDQYGIVYVHQSQTIDDRIFNLKRVLTLVESKEEVEKNTDFLGKAISHFKSENKTVIVIGKSHGAYVVQDYLATKSPSADKYFIISGRLRMNPEMTRQQVKGFNGEFSDDGLTYIPEDENADLSEYSEMEIMQYKNKQMLKAGYGSTDYIQALAEVDLSNVTYIYGSKDRNIGSLTSEEVEFLESKGVKVLAVETDHSGTTYALIDWLVDKTIIF